MANSLKITGVMQLIFAVSALVLESIFTIGIESVWSWNTCDFFTGAGFWAFPFYLTASCLGTVAGKRQRPSRCLVISYMVMSIIASVVAGLALGFTVAAADEDWTCYNYRYHFRHDSGPLVQVPIIFLILVHFSQLITAIVASGFCCRIFGCNCCSCTCCDEQPLQQPLLPADLLPASQLGATHGDVRVTLTPQQQQQFLQQLQAPQHYGQTQYFAQPSYQATANMPPNVPIHTQPYASSSPPAMPSGPPAPENEGAMPNPPAYTEKGPI